jgi:peptide/nickel transport system substrate-binding protein
VSLEVPQGAGRIYYKWGIIDATTGRFIYTSAEASTMTAPIAITVPADVTSKLTANRPYKFWVLAYAENVPIVTEATQVFVPKAAAPTPTSTATTPPTTPTPTPTTAPSPTAITTTTVAPATGTTEALAAGVVGILAVLGALAFALRRRGGGGQETKTR